MADGKPHETGPRNGGKMSLDHQLQSASSTVESLVFLCLDRLSELIEKTLDIAEGNVIPWDRLPRPMLEGMQFPAEEDGGMPTTQLGQLAISMAEAITGLTSFNNIIRNPTPRYRYTEAQSTDEPRSKPFDVQYMVSKYNHIERFLAEQLGEAIGRRRRYLDHQRSHYEKLSHELNEIERCGGKPSRTTP